MPIYDFFCPKCGKEILNEFRKLGAPLKFPCECGGEMEVKIGAPSMILTPAAGRKACRSCRNRNMMNGNYSKGGCDGGKKCRGYAPINMAEAKKKTPAMDQMLQARRYRRGIR